MKIGIIQTAFIGDVVLTALLVEGLYQAGHEIIFFTKAKTRAIFENDSRVCKVVVLNKPKGIQKVFALYRMISQIKDEKLDALICPHRSLTTTLCAYFSNVKLTVGFQNATLSFLYKVKRPYIAQMHECFRYLSLLIPKLCPKEILERVEKIGRPILRLAPAVNPVVKPRGDTAILSSRGEIVVSSHGLTAGTRPYFVVAVGSAWNTKKYVREYLSEICLDILSTYPNLTCYLTGDKNDVAECQSLAESLSRYETRVVNTAGKSDMMNFVNILKNAKFIIANDSSPIHFSSAFNVPIVSFWGPTILEYGFGPLAQEHLVISHKTLFQTYLPCQPCGKHGAKKCPQKHHLCMKKMTPKNVLPKIKNFLENVVKLDPAVTPRDDTVTSRNRLARGERPLQDDTKSRKK